MRVSLVGFPCCSYRKHDHKGSGSRGRFKVLLEGSADAGRRGGARDGGAEKRPAQGVSDWIIYPVSGTGLTLERCSDAVNKQFFAFFSKMFQILPKDRISALECAKMPWTDSAETLGIKATSRVAMHWRMDMLRSPHPWRITPAQSVDSEASGSRTESSAEVNQAAANAPARPRTLLNLPMDINPVSSRSVDFRNIEEGLAKQGYTVEQYRLGQEWWTELRSRVSEKYADIPRLLPRDG
jgi:hypothetical protein